jgi:hypothetical protein
VINPGEGASAMRPKGPPILSTAVTDMRQVVATIDGRPRQAGDRYIYLIFAE